MAFPGASAHGAAYAAAAGPLARRMTALPLLAAEQVECESTLKKIA